MRLALASIVLSISVGSALSSCVGGDGPRCGANVDANLVVQPSEPCLNVSTSSCEGVSNTTAIANQCTEVLTLSLTPSLDGADDSGNLVIAAGQTVSIFGRDVTDGGVVFSGGPTGRATVSGVLGVTPVILTFDVPSS